MRRALPAVLLTLAGLGALGMFHSAAPAATRTATAAPATTPAATAPPPDGTTPTPDTTPTPTTVPSSGSATKTYDGDAYDNRYGTVQVRITVQGTQITAIEALQMPYEHNRSQYISEQAEPLLRQEALQAQSAQIDIVIGET